jgi:hypothetical protein
MRIPAEARPPGLRATGMAFTSGAELGHYEIQIPGGVKETAMTVRLLVEVVIIVVVICVAVRFFRKRG